MTDILFHPVECFSGYEYAERPTAINWCGVRLEVNTIQAQWRNPEGKSFRVVATNGSLFELFLHHESDTWVITAL